MYKRYLDWLAQGGYLLAPEDAGGAGASTAEGDAGASHAQEDNTNDDDAADGEPQAGLAPTEGDDDDDLLVSDEDFSDTPFHQHPRFKAVTSKLKKLARQNTRLKTTADRYKGVDLDTLRTRASVAEQLEGLFSRNRGLHKQVLEALAAGDTPAAAAEPEFDPKNLPFDVNDEVGKYFVQQHKVIDKLTKQIEGLTNTNAQTARQTYESSWKTATGAAAAALPEHVRLVFEDAMYGAYRVAMADGKHVDPQKFVNQYLGKLKARGVITGKAAERSSAAAAQRTAENNKQLPRRPAGGGTPATARKPETVAEVSRRLKRQFSA